MTSRPSLRLLHPPTTSTPRDELIIPELHNLLHSVLHVRLCVIWLRTVDV